MRSNRQCVSAILLSLLVVLVSCGSDEDPVQPPFSFSPDLESLWPHANGNSWTFDVTSVICPEDGLVFYDNREDVPPNSSFEILYSRLQGGFSCEEGDWGTGTLLMEFDGEVAVAPEIIAQNLKSEIQYDQCCASAPLALFPRQWRMSEDMIVAYSDGKAFPDTNWTYLTSDLHPGAEFSQVLQFNFDIDFILQGRIWRHLQYDLPDGSKANAVECFYLLDYGIQNLTDENGELVGYVRFNRYGVIIYAENVGPVYCHEQSGWTRSGDPATGVLSVSSDIKAVLVE